MADYGLPIGHGRPLATPPGSLPDSKEDDSYQQGRPFLIFALQVGWPFCCLIPVSERSSELVQVPSIPRAITPRPLHADSDVDFQAAIANEVRKMQA